MNSEQQKQTQKALERGKNILVNILSTEHGNIVWTGTVLSICFGVEESNSKRNSDILLLLKSEKLGFESRYLFSFLLSNAWEDGLTFYRCIKPIRVTDTFSLVFHPKTAWIEPLLFGGLVLNFRSAYLGDWVPLKT